MGDELLAIYTAARMSTAATEAGAQAASPATIAVEVASRSTTEPRVLSHGELWRVGVPSPHLAMEVGCSPWAARGAG